MSKLFVFFLTGVAAAALGKTFVKYQEVALLGAQEKKTENRETYRSRMEIFKEKYATLKQKSNLLDRSVETNEKLEYLTRSDDFEEALFLIDYLGERFSEKASMPFGETALEDIDFYLQRLEDNLMIVERALAGMGAKDKTLAKARGL